VGSGASISGAESLAAVSGLTVCAAPIDLGEYSVSILWQKTADNHWMRQVISDAFLAILPGLEAIYSG
jgi:hypothetical protein